MTTSVDGAESVIAADIDGDGRTDLARDLDGNRRNYVVVSSIG